MLRIVKRKSRDALKTGKESRDALNTGKESKDALKIVKKRKKESKTEQKIRDALRTVAENRPALLEIPSIFSTSVVLFRSRGRISPSSGSKIKNPTPKTFIYVIQIEQDSPSLSVTYIEIISVVENGFVS